VAALSGTTVASLSVTDGGSGYTSAPTVSFSGGGGSGAAATAVIGGRVSSVSITNRGQEYTSAPTVSFSGGGGSGAAATATLRDQGPILSISVTGAGSGYTATPTVSLSGGGGSGASATAVLAGTSVNTVTVTAGGTGYTSAPTVTFTGGGGSSAAANATQAGAVVASVTVTAGGTGYTGDPTVTLTDGGGTGATATATRGGGYVTGFTVTAAGSNYTSTPTVVVSGGAGTGAAGTAVMGGGGTVSVISVTDSGSGYTFQPTVTISGGGGSGATATVDWIVSYDSFFIFGAYVVLLQADGEDRRIRWCAPGRTDVWDEYEEDGGVEIETGAGVLDLPGEGALEYGVSIGTAAVLFDADGVGVLLMTGDWQNPFSYAKNLSGITADGTPRLYNGRVWFPAHDGRVWSTSGYAAEPMDGPLDLDAYSGVTWPPASDAQFAFNTETGHFVLQTGSKTFWINAESGGYSVEATTPAITTGALEMAPGNLADGGSPQPEAERVHVQRVRLNVHVASGSPTVTISYRNLYATDWITSNAMPLATGNSEVEMAINAIAGHPVINVTFGSVTGEVRLFGMVLFYETGGLH